MIIVVYQTGSAYEKFLLSGFGAAHYDAAREFPDGTFQPYWLGAMENLYHNATHHLLPAKEDRD